MSAPAAYEIPGPAFLGLLLLPKKDLKEALWTCSRFFQHFHVDAAASVTPVRADSCLRFGSSPDVF